MSMSPRARECMEKIAAGVREILTEIEPAAKLFDQVIAEGHEKLDGEDLVANRVMLQQLHEMELACAAMRAGNLGTMLGHVEEVLKL